VVELLLQRGNAGRERCCGRDAASTLVSVPPPLLHGT
jgi:hypothetical protein